MAVALTAFGVFGSEADAMGGGGAVSMPAGRGASTISSRCAGNRGVISAVVTNEGKDDATYSLRANQLTARRAIVKPASTGEVVVGGVGDGVWTVRLNENGVTIARATLTIDCDPVNDQTGIVTTCLAATGRLDAYVENDAPTTRRMAVTVSSAGGVHTRALFVPAETVGRTTVTGLRDGPVLVSVGTVGDEGERYFFRANVACRRDANEPVPVIRLDPAVRAVLEHEATSFTQGLTFADDGRLFESSGAYNDETRVREINPATGAVVRQVGLGRGFFGEGLAAVGDDLWLLSWKEQIVRVLDQDTLAVRATYPYDGQGWGLCFDGTSFVRSDGTARLVRHRVADFAPIETIQVTRAGEPVPLLNELECFGGQIWANVWFSDDVVRIDPRSGVVDLVIDVSALEQPRPGGTNAVANGIAFDPNGARLWLTGKLWTTYSVYELPLAPGG